jgi:hypothetical protein
MSGTPLKLNACGCCEKEAPLNTIFNRPGLSALTYRIGRYSLFMQRLLDEIHAAAIPDGPNAGTHPLAVLTTRALDDPSIAFLDAWAIVADVLTFYQERIVNEGYLRTSTERRSVLELARAIAYELGPGVAASAYLQFTVEEVIGAATPISSIPGLRTPTPAGPGNSAFNSGIVRIPAGTQVQSVPAPGKLPQTFETSADFEARVGWNHLTPRLSRPADLALSNGKLYLLGTSTSFLPGTFINLPTSQVFLLNPRTYLPPGLTQVPAVEIGEIYLQGSATNLKIGDTLLLVGHGYSGVVTEQFIVRLIDPQPSLNWTRVAFVDQPSLPSFAPASFSSLVLTLNQVPFTQANVNAYILQKAVEESDLDAFLRINSWDASELSTAVNSPPSPVPSEFGTFALRSTAAFFGHNAQPWKSLPDPAKSQRSDPFPLDWDAANGGQGRYIWTDSQGNPYEDADVYLERAFAQVLANSWALFESPSLTAAYRITRRVDRSLADFGLSGKVTGLTLQLQGGSRAEGLSAPSAVSWAANRLDSFSVGFDGDLYHEWWNGSAWGGPENLGGGNLWNSPSVASWAANRLDVFAIGSDGHLYHKWWNGSAWGGPENLGGSNLRNSPSAVAWAANRLDIFAIGADGHLYHKWWNGSAWGGPENLGGGNLVGSPSAVSWAANRLDIFATGSDGKLYHKWWNGSAWGVLHDVGGATATVHMVSSPSAVSWSANRLDIFVNGSDRNLYHKWWDGSNWGPATDLENLGGGNFVKSPSAVSWAPNRLDVFSLGWDGNLHHHWWNGSSWGGPENLGGNGNLTSAPSATSWAANRLDIFLVGASGHLFHKFWAGSWWGGPEDLNSGNTLAPFPVRKTTAFVESEQLALADIPVEGDIPSAISELMLNDLALGLKPGQAVALTGIRADAHGVTANEIQILRDVVHVGGVTVLKFVGGLRYSYLRPTLTINANVSLATNGTTAQEVLGNGDASQTNQSFTLKRPPLTYVSAPTSSGVASTLEIRVNDLLWQESPTLYGLDARDEKYIVRLADDATPTVTFGDPAERLRTGQQNVRATYRTGIGLGGNVDAGSLAILQSRPPGLRAVSNPLAASGGADPQDLAHARANAPITVLTLDRIVSLDDYENFSRAFGGIGKAQAIALWSGENRLVHITIAAASGDPVEPTSQLYHSLVQAIDQSRDPVQRVVVASFQPLAFNLSAAVLIDKPRYLPAVVLAEVADALANGFSFENRSFAQGVSAAEVVTLIQSVAGVVATDLNQLYLTTDPAGPSQVEPAPFIPSAPARFVGGTIQPAQLLLLNPLGATLTEMTA